MGEPPQQRKKPTGNGPPAGRRGPDAPLVDFHCHVIPGVDDGAADVDQGLAALQAFRDQGVGTVVATPHLDASVTERTELLSGRLAAFDAGLAELEASLADSGLDIRLERGTELKLDAPEPRFGDDRVRLAGTRFVLVEFVGFQVPPYGARQLASIRDEGWLPILAHPERYRGLEQAFDRAFAWREAGAYFQLNAGSLTGYYGPEVEKAARRMLELGWADYLASDYHSRGLPHVAEALEVVRGATADEDDPAPAEAARLLAEINPARMLEGLEPFGVPPIAFARRRRGLRQFF